MLGEVNFTTYYVLIFLFTHRNIRLNKARMAQW